MTNSEKFKDVFGFGADGSRVIAVNATWWDCEYQSHKRSNADRIRCMTNDELLEFIQMVYGNGRAGLSPTNGWEKWLNKPHSFDESKEGE